MPTLIRTQGEGFVVAEDPFTAVADDELLPKGDVIISLTRFQSEGDRLLSEGRQIGVRIEPAEEVEALAYDLPRLIDHARRIKPGLEVLTLSATTGQGMEDWYAWLDRARGA